MRGKIYRYTNKINGKIYIGQTIREMDVRDKRHQKDSKYGSNLYFHRALRKYGRDNFDLDIIEDNIQKEELDEKEKYWIKKLNSFYLAGCGYNMTEGGQWGNAPRKLADSEIEDIQQMLLINTELSITDIAKEFDVSISCVSDINTGRTWKKEKYSYPIRDNVSGLVSLTEELYENIVYSLKNEDLTQEDIAKKYGTVESIVSNVNNGKVKFSEKNFNYPIRKFRVQSNTQMDRKDIYRAIEMYLIEDCSMQEIAIKFNVKKCYIKAILVGNLRKPFTNMFMFPLRKNSEYNKKKLNLLLT